MTTKLIQDIDVFVNRYLEEGHSIRQDRKIGIASISDTKMKNWVLNWSKLKNNFCTFSDTFL